ncbi:hypothetical protein ElyMa_001875400 [Elysia marginata]|uniref:Uncharacterized protein n=1 Tax=Elysia marginata TaxID=1093978 RepID=A0AAV4EPE4_9GAST|nr:hypothetical protein ElyMa_001875400 [Elysia marginata]
MGKVIYELNNYVTLWHNRKLELMLDYCKTGIIPPIAAATMPPPVPASTSTLSTIVTTTTTTTPTTTTATTTPPVTTDSVSDAPSVVWEEGDLNPGGFPDTFGPAVPVKVKSGKRTDDDRSRPHRGGDGTDDGKSPLGSNYDYFYHPSGKSEDKSKQEGQQQQPAEDKQAREITYMMYASLVLFSAMLLITIVHMCIYLTSDRTSKQPKYVPMN